MGGTAGRSRFVDYDRVAGRYQRGRRLPADALARWRDAVLPHVPDRPLRVVDIGAGTGFFASAWAAWSGATTVVAVEPNLAMIRAGPRHVRYVRAAAEHLPIATGSVDLAWVSTALHHFTDLTRAIGECARILRAQGTVLVRTFLPGRTRISWVGAFPGHAKALARFPDLDRLRREFGRHGLTVDQVTEVFEGTRSFADWADWAERMRHADSMLTALTESELDTGLRALRADPDRQAPAELSLVVLRRSVPATVAPAR